MAKTNKRWTLTEDETLLRYVKHYPQNLHKAFMLVSEQFEHAKGCYPRTVSGVQAHWYTVLSKRPEALCFFTASERHLSRNRKNGMGVESNTSIWKKLLNIIRGL